MSSGIGTIANLQGKVDATNALVVSVSGGISGSLIQTVTPTTTVATFSSLGAYTHLQIRYSARGDQSATNTLINLTFNADGGSNYDRQSIQGSAATASAAEVLGAAAAACGSVVAATGTAGAAGTGTINIYDYRGTTFNKNFDATNTSPRGTSSGLVVAINFMGRWRSTAAITSIELTLASGSYVTGSTFSLYGIL